MYSDCKVMGYACTRCLQWSTAIREGGLLPRLYVSPTTPLQIESNRADMNSLAWGAASDVVLALYPMFVFYRLNVSLRRKIFLSALMGGGLKRSLRTV